MVLAWGLCGCTGWISPEPFVGTWDLQSGENARGGDDLSEESIATLRDLGLDAYLNLDDSGALTLVSASQAKQGDWKPTGATTANATVEGQSATITLDGEFLRLKQNDTVLVFYKGDPKASALDAVLSSQEGETAEASNETTGLSEMIVRGALWDKPVTAVNNRLCKLVINGTGTDRLGDPGFNLQITNKTDGALDFWITKPFMVGETKVRAYLCETVPARSTITAFLQFDTADIASTNPAVLKAVSGEILIDDDQNTTLATVPFNY